MRSAEGRTTHTDRRGAVRAPPLLWAALALALGGCPGIVLELDDDDDAEVHGALVVTPSAIDFGDLAVGHEARALVTLFNAGDAPLQLRELRVVGPASLDLRDVPADRVLAPSEIYALQVEYAPLGYEVVDGRLRVTTNDPDDPDVEIPLRGRGLAPAIRLDPPALSFDGVSVGCARQAEVGIWNDGTAALTVDDVWLETVAAELDESHGFEDTVIEPGHRAAVTVHYLPGDEFPDVGYLHVASDDPARPDAEVVVSATAELGEHHIDTFVHEPDDRADVLFVVDDSCSMDGEHEALHLALGPFLDALTGLDADFRLGVITTSDPRLRGPVITPETGAPHDALFAAADVGTAGASVEQGLARALEALTPPLSAPGGANDGFQRDDASLQLVFVSDEDDQSDGAVADLAAALQALRTEPAAVRAHAFVDEGFVGGRYVSVSAATGGATACLCDPAWIDDLATVAEGFVEPGGVFELSALPVIDTLAVSVDGVPLFSGWSYDAGVNAVVFETAYLPDPGAHVEVQYHVVEVC